MSPPTTPLDDLRIDRTSRAAGGPLRRVWLLSILLLVTLSGAGWWWSAGSQAATVRTVTVRETRGEDTAPTVLNASGYVTARRRATVSSKVTGKVVEVLVEEGMQVHEGQVLARLDASTIRSQLALAEARLGAARSAVTESDVRRAEARLTLNRTRELADQGVVTRADLDAAQAEVDSLQARIALAREQVVVAEREVEVRRTELNDMVIRAPFSGVAISKNAQPGEMISPVSAGGGFTRTGIATIVDMSSLEIEVDVTEASINRVSPGQPVEAVLDAYPEWRIPARVITTVPAADRQRATLLVRIAFDQLDPRILPDMGVKVAFFGTAPPDRDRGATRLVLPSAALRNDGGQAIVFVVREDRVERRAVRLGSRSGDEVTVIAGLSAGERLVIDGPPDLANGDRVVVR